MVSLEWFDEVPPVDNEPLNPVGLLYDGATLIDPRETGANI